jgi:hypothetical protein
MANGVLTPEIAQGIDLPSFVHPIQRVREIGRLANEASSSNIVGWFPFEQRVFTRRGLVELAEARAKAAEWDLALNQARERGENNGEDF